jgi:pSer/pThr/pTyr-binding forkhead associated (FHA) protein
MRDGYTRQVERPDEFNPDFVAFQERWQASVVLLSGDDSGAEFALEQLSTTLGRGESAHLRFDDSSMSSEHAALEFFNAGIRLRDLGSMNGTTLNGSDVKAAELKNGDRFQLGSHEFQFVLVDRPKRRKTYDVPIS